MALSKLLLSILRTEYETPAVGDWVTSRQADVADGTEARHTTSEGARSAVVACGNDGSDQPVILDNHDDLDKARSGGQAEGASGKVDTGRIELDASLHNSLPTSKLALAPTESIDTSCPWYDVEEARYVEETTRDLGLMSSTACLLLPYNPNPRSSLNHPSHCKIRPTSKMSASSDSGDDDERTDENMVELEKELGLALGEQVESSLASTPTSPSPRSVEAPQDKIRSRERSETTGGRQEELRDASGRGSPAQDLEWWEQRETDVLVEWGAVAMQHRRKSSGSQL
ncbi:hypothetical protein IFR05_011683 [Cadophora sp. M221]|nr:hypothetical protein IFR05_011683 [Cadophora sp. M221]